MDVHQINCTFPDAATLNAAYMPFIKGGGIFIRTNQEFELGAIVSMSINLMNEEVLQSHGKIVWITPIGAQGNKVSGVGVQFLRDNGPNLCNKIETYLVDVLKSSQLTDTI